MILTRMLIISTASMVLCLPISNSFSQEQSHAATFSGVVLDRAESAPIAYAHVWIHEQSGKSSLTARLDKAGQFSIQLSAGYYDVLFAAPGFAPSCKKIWIRPDSPVKVKVNLGPDKENSQAN